ncbi:cell wall hydrolase [Paenibacillus pinistramenti]|uniref:cell wall hydrolase n=1 Tax=Paenibacillus pinistramenti TaxID=1768003 RepID=UPI001EF1540D|nr:cell wall hydrolase [Paenibacillus pinistramenti]
MLWNVQQPRNKAEAAAVPGIERLSVNASTAAAGSAGSLNARSGLLSNLPVQSFAAKSRGIVLPQNTYGENDPGKPADAAADAGKAAAAAAAAAKAKRQAAVKTAAATPEASAAPAADLNPPITLFFTRTSLLSKEDKDKAVKTYTVTKEDLLLLEKIVMAEAEGEPYEGKVAVANVVLNRLRSANYPDTIHDVVYEKHQFSPVANGRLNRVQPNEDTRKAVADALSGRKEVSDDTYYFLSLKLATDLSVHNHKKITKTIGNHTFYK